MYFGEGLATGCTGCMCAFSGDIYELAKDKDLSLGNVVILTTKFYRQEQLFYWPEDTFVCLDELLVAEM